MSAAFALIEPRDVSTAGYLLLLVSVGLYRRKRRLWALAAVGVAFTCLAAGAIAEGTPGRVIMVAGCALGAVGMHLDDRGQRGAGFSILSLGIFIALSGAFVLGL